MPNSRVVLVALTGVLCSALVTPVVAADTKGADSKKPAEAKSAVEAKKPADSKASADSKKPADSKATADNKKPADTKTATDAKSSATGDGRGDGSEGHRHHRRDGDWGMNFTEAERAEMKKDSDAMQKALCEKHYVHGISDMEKSQVEKGYLEAVQLFKEKKFAEAKARFTKAIEAFDQPQEKALFKTLTMASFKHSRNYVGRASCCYEMQDYAGAVKDCDQAIKICPDYSQPYIVRARSYKALKLNDAYIKDISTASTLETMPRALAMDVKSMSNLMRNTSRIFAEKLKGMENRVADRTYVNGMAGMKKSRSGPLMMSGMELENKGDFKGADGKFSQALAALHDKNEIALWKDKAALDRRRATAYSHLAYCKLNMKEYKDAVGYLTYAIKLNPNSSQAYINRSKAYAKLGMMKESEADANKAASIKSSHQEKPDNPEKMD